MFCKLSMLLKNKNKSYIINKLMTIAFTILILLFILLLLSMYGPSINSIQLERSDLITVISSIISGYLGLIGSFMGILVTYWIFHKEILLEKQSKEEEKNEQKQYALDMLSGLLSYTIREYSVYWTALGNYAFKMLSEICHDEKEVNECLNFIKNIPHEEFFEIKNEVGAIKKYTEKQRELIQTYFDALYGANTEMICMYKTTPLPQWEIKENIIYDKNWLNYLYYVDSEYREYVIKWINYLENNSTNNTNSFVEVVIWREKVLDLQISLGHKSYEKYKIINIIKSFENEDLEELINIQSGLIK